VWAPLEPSPAGGGLQFTLHANVAAGVQGVTLGTATSGQLAPIAGAEQQVLRIRPEVTQPAANANNTAVTVTVAPPLQPGQTAVLSLVASDAGADPAADSVQIPLAIIATSTQATFPLPAGLAAGQYLTILEVDGVASLPTLVGGVYAEPAVALS
jgi:hypothetical protein